MPAERRVGMDHPHYAWSPLPERSVLRWPQAARVALAVVVNLEHMEWAPPDGSFQTVLAGGVSPRPAPDYARFSHRDYGHRVGIFRVLDVLQKHGIKPTVAMDTATAEHYPYVVQHCLSRGCEIIGHGAAATQVMSEQMGEQQERDYIRQAISTLTQATGQAPVGWLGPEYGESSRTPQLLAQAGVRYVCDWVNDEQPYRMTTTHGDLCALPIMLELDDVHALWERRVPIDRYGVLLQESFDVLYRDGAQSGRVFVLHLHPWLIGQPFRIGTLDDALASMVRRQSVWAASGGEIVEWYRQQAR